MIYVLIALLLVFIGLEVYALALARRAHSQIFEELRQHNARLTDSLLEMRRLLALQATRDDFREFMPQPMPRAVVDPAAPLQAQQDQRPLSSFVRLVLADGRFGHVARADSNYVRDHLNVGGTVLPI